MQRIKLSFFFAMKDNTGRQNPWSWDYIMICVNHVISCNCVIMDSSVFLWGKVVSFLFLSVQYCESSDLHYNKKCTGTHLMSALSPPTPTKESLCTNSTMLLPQQIIFWESDTSPQWESWGVWVIEKNLSN